MKPNNSEPQRDKLRQQIVHLAAGELGPLDAWRLRRRIARDPELAREWGEVKALWKDMKLLRTATPHVIRPDRPALLVAAPTLTLGGITMKRRTVIAAFVTVLFAVTGAVAARQWMNFGPSAAIGDRQGRLWHLSGNFRGKVTIYDAAGKMAGRYRNDSGDPETGVLKVDVAGTHAELPGSGKYPILNKDGVLLGTLELSTLSDQDRSEMLAAADDAERELVARYNAGPGFPLASDGSSGLTSMPGVVIGYDQSRGLSWKMLGYGSVTARYLHPHLSQQAGQSAPFTPEQLRDMPPQAREYTQRLVSLAPPTNAEPEIYWTRAGKDKRGTYPVQNGWWKEVQSTGKIQGYGRHEVKDTSGRTVLVLNVTPLTHLTPAR
jgi:hypothetical protein